MKGILAFLLAFSLLFTLAACQKDEGKKTPASRYSDDDADEDEKQPQAQSFEPIFIFDEPGYLVTVTGWNDNRMDIRFENRSSDTTYDFDYESCSFNGLSTNISLYCKLDPGQSHTNALYVPDKYENLLEQITHISLTVTVDVNYEQVNKNTIDYYPLGEEAATVYERTPETTDEAILDSDSLSVVATGYSLDRSNFKINLFLENHAPKPINVNFLSFTVDGFLISVIAPITIGADSGAFHTISIPTTDLQKCGIRKLENISCTLQTILDTEKTTTPITFAPKDLFVAKLETDFTPVTIFHKENCYSMEVSNMTTSDTGVVTLLVSMKNLSQTTSYQFQLADIYTNAIKANKYLNQTLAPGQKSVDTISLTKVSQDDAQDICNISAQFSVSDAESYSLEDSKQILLYPQESENHYQYRRKIKVTDHMLLDNEYLTVVATQYKDSYDGGLQVELYYYNKCEQPIHVEWENCKINGIEKSTYHGFTLQGNCAYFTSEYVYDDFLTENNITQIDSITVDLQLKESSSYNAKAYFTQNMELMNEPFAVTTEETTEE